MPTERVRLSTILAKGPVLAPGVYDGLSALAADQAGAQALYLTGYGVSASLLAQPDAGFLEAAHMIERIEKIRAVSGLPIIADADTGFGDADDIARTVRAYAEAGADAIQIEDQVWPKRCGHTQGRKVVSREDAKARITAAVNAKPSVDTLIIARTDARTEHGIEEAVARAKLFADAGADLLFVESPESEAELEAIARSLPGQRLVANMVPGGRTPHLPFETLAAMGYALVIHPVYPMMAAAKALQGAYTALISSGDVGAMPDTISFADLNKLVGFERVWAEDEA